jgi:transposase
MFGCAPAPGALASAARKTVAFLAPALQVITGHLIAADVAHFDETGFRTAGRLAWVHSASAGKFALFTVHAKRGKDGMRAAGVLPFFEGIAVHDAWAPYDSFAGVAGHALCGAHVLRELTAVTDTGTDLDRTWAQQAIDALLALNDAAGAARQAGRTAIDEDLRNKHENWYRRAAETGIALNAARSGKLQQKRHALATRMKDREDDYLRFARDLRVPFSNNAAEQSIRMCKLRIKISGCMRSMAGAEEFCAIRSYLATTARHGIGALEALSQAFQANPWIPETGRPARHHSTAPAPESPGPGLLAVIVRCLLPPGRLPDVQPHPSAGQLFELAAEPVGLLAARTGHQDGPGGADTDLDPVRGPADVHRRQPDHPLYGPLHRTADRDVLRSLRLGTQLLVLHDPAGHGVLLASLGHPGPDLILERAVVSHANPLRRRCPAP